MTIAIAIFLCIFLAGVGAYLYFVYSPSTHEPTLTGTATFKQIVVGNTTRAYVDYAPSTLSPNSPLLIVFHGTQQNGKTIRYSTGYQFDLFAD